MELLSRGVYEAPYLSAAGVPIAFAVTSTGLRLGEMAYSGDAELRVVRRALWALLQEADPVPMLKLA